MRDRIVRARLSGRVVFATLAFALATWTEINGHDVFVAGQKMKRGERSGVRWAERSSLGALLRLNIFRVGLGCPKRNRVKTVSETSRSRSSLRGGFCFTWRAAGFSAPIFLGLQETVYFLDKRH